MTIRFDRVEEAVIAVIRVTAGAGVTALWAPSDYPRRALGASIMTARHAGGPTMRVSQVYNKTEPTRLLWTVSSAVEDQRVGVHMTGAQWTVDVTAGQSDEDVRDALLVLLTADTLPGVTIAASGSDSIDFDASGVPGLLWRAGAIGPTATLGITTSVACEVETGPAALTIELQAYGSGRAGEAHSILGNVRGGLSSSDVVGLQTVLGVSFLGISDAVDLTALAGADWESRASARLFASVQSYRARAEDSITRVDFTATTNEGTTSGSVTAP